MDASVQPPVLPLRAACATISDEQCDRVFRLVMQARQGLNPSTRTRLQRALRSALKIPGFRDASRAPENLLAQHSVCAFRRHSDELVAALLEAWFELQATLATQVGDYLTQRAIATGIVRPFPLTFVARHDPGELHQLAEEYVESNPAAILDDVVVMAFCLAELPEEVFTDRTPARDGACSDSGAVDVEEDFALNDQLKKVETEIDSLAARFRELGARLVAAGQLLADQETPPSHDISEELENATRAFAALRSRVEDLREQCDLPRDIVALSGGLGDIRAAVTAIVEAAAKQLKSEETRQTALGVLDRIQGLSHRDHPDFEQLLECQARARDLHLALTQSPTADHPDADALTNGSHPFARLLSWVEHGDELDDDQWQQANDSVTKTFGRLLATAVARGKLIATPGPNLSDTVPSLISAEPPAAQAQGQVRDEARETQDRFTEAESGSVIEAPSTPEPVLETAGQIDEVRVELTEGGDGPVLTVPTEEAVSTTKGTVESKETATSPDQPPPTVVGDADKERIERVQNAMWSLLADSRPGLAFHVAHWIEERSTPSKPAIPSWVLRCVALAPHILTPNGDIAAALRSDFVHFHDEIFEPSNSERNQALRFLLAAAALRPALIAPSTGAAAILHSLHFKDGVSAFFNYCRAVASHADTGQPLDPNSLKRVRTVAGWQAALESLQREVNAWCAQAPSMTMVFAAASKVWWNWQASGGLIHSLLQPVRKNEIGRRAVVKELVNRLSDEANIKREIVHTDREILKRRRGDDISAKALGQLLKHTRDALEFGRRWLSLHENNPSVERGYLQTLAENVRQNVLSREKTCLDELAELNHEASSPAVQAALTCCLHAVNDISRLFDPDASLQPIEQSPNEALNVDLLYTPLPLTAEWALEATSSETAEAVLELCSKGTFCLEEAFDLRTALRDHEGTALITEQLERIGTRAEEIAQLRERREKSLSECRSALDREVEQASTDVEKAVAFGLLTEKERFELIARTDKVAITAPELLRFRGARDELHAVRDEIEEKRALQVAEVQRRLDTTALDETVRSRVLAVLDQGDVLTANEYIDIARSGRPLPSTEIAPDAFSRFFPDSYQAIEKFLEPQDLKRRPDPNGLVKDLRALAKGSSRTNVLGPVSLNQVRGKQMEQAADMLEAWFTTKRAQRADVEAVRQILLGLGFGHMNVSGDRSGRRVWLKVTCDPVRDRERCPVSIFGSAAEGHYRVLCAWDRPTEEDLIADVSETTHGAPAIVFYFGRMGEKVRRDLAERCRRRRRTFVVIDDVLILHLCGERGSRLPTMFRCALPFTFLEPYAVTAGVVPPEMFYGREGERQQIMDPMGSCFIYGGRQLGKTALLRDVEQTFNRPASGHIGLWLDLKTYGIGIDRPIDELWNRLGMELKRLNLVPQNTPSHASADTILNHVQTWLDEARDRRMLLLLDEADRFLDQDGKEDFVHTARLKGLMDRTSRRFKVVFAGLHNVQRTTRLENNPLAHYGEPICIGPLLQNGEWNKAWQLVEQPLISIGYKFQSPDLITRILSQTNYYPSLIQLYCNQLLRHMYDRRAEVPGPPYSISSRDVEEAYQSQELRKAIRDRFTWTLDLDPRYRLIAFCLALHSSEEPDRADKGVAVSWIRERALSFWPKGFREVLSEDVFRVLLDEMVGLGVLRIVEGGQYALRSLNVITLLGSKDEIESEIFSFFDREPPAPFEAATFRSSFRSTAGAVDPALRNPLTAAQESEAPRQTQRGVDSLRVRGVGAC